VLKKDTNSKIRTHKNTNKNIVNKKAKEQAQTLGIKNEIIFL
jgi:hypothetical protein